MISSIDRVEVCVMEITNLILCDFLFDDMEIFRFWVKEMTCPTETQLLSESYLEVAINDVDFTESSSGSNYGSVNETYSHIQEKSSLDMELQTSWLSTWDLKIFPDAVFGIRVRENNSANLLVQRDVNNLIDQ